MQRRLYADVHEDYRETVRAFLAREVEPAFLEWEEQRVIDRAVFLAAAKQGIYALVVPGEYGGAGERDYRFRMVVN
jgi:alkylation response protein AidB-like acyl-CoA dehydrogenase